MYNRNIDCIKLMNSSVFESDIGCVTRSKILQPVNNKGENGTAYLHSLIINFVFGYLEHIVVNLQQDIIYI